MGPAVSSETKVRIDGVSGPSHRPTDEVRRVSVNGQVTDFTGLPFPQRERKPVFNDFVLPGAGQRPQDNSKISQDVNGESELECA